MKMKSILTGAAVFGVSVSCVAGIAGFNDIEFWVGSGVNEAALVLDFHDGQASESFAWGYRWDGVASGADMLIDIAAADANLSVLHDGDGNDGFFLYTIDYNDGINTHTTGVESWSSFLSGGFAGEDVAGDPAAVIGGGTTLPASWTSSPSGASLNSFGSSGRVLDNGAWDAWGLGNWVESSPGVWDHDGMPGSTIQAAIPEPASAVLMLCGFGGMVWFRRRRKYFFRG